MRRPTSADCATLGLRRQVLPGSRRCREQERGKRRMAEAARVEEARLETSAPRRPSRWRTWSSDSATSSRSTASPWTSRPGEFFSLLGPSGSGKTTCLRMIAGFELPTSGRILLDGRDVSDLPPFERDVNTVFQDYALFPHMTVAQNVGYGLMVRKTPKASERARRGRAGDGPPRTARGAGSRDSSPEDNDSGWRSRARS